LNRLYYSCFYAVNALLVKDGKSSSKHSGVRSIFNKDYVQNGTVPKETAVTYNDLFDLRQECDYEDFFQADEKIAGPFIPRVKDFIDFINSLL